MLQRCIRRARAAERRHGRDDEARGPDRPRRLAAAIERASRRTGGLLGDGAEGEDLLREEVAGAGAHAEDAHHELGHAGVGRRLLLLAPALADRAEVALRVDGLRARHPPADERPAAVPAGGRAELGVDGAVALDHELVGAHVVVERDADQLPEARRVQVFERHALAVGVEEVGQALSGELGP